MDITKAIAVAKSQHDVMFLLAAYVENLEHCNACALPGEPEHALSDNLDLDTLQARALRALPRAHAWDVASVMVQAEAATIFEAGTNRLRELTHFNDNHNPQRATPHAAYNSSGQSGLHATAVGDRHGVAAACRTPLAA